MLVMALTANVLCVTPTAVNTLTECDDTRGSRQDEFGLCKLLQGSPALLYRLRELLRMNANGYLRVLPRGTPIYCNHLFHEQQHMKADCEKDYPEQLAPFRIKNGDQSYKLYIAEKDLPSLSSIKAFEGEISQEAKQVEPDQFIVFKDRVYPFACTLKSENCLLSQVLFEIQQLKDSSSSQIQKLKDANSVFRDLNRVFKTEFISVNPDF